MNVYQKPNKYNKNNYRQYIPPNYGKFQEQYESEENELITPDIPMTFKKMNSLLSHVNDMIDIRLARNVEGKPCIISGKMHLHMAMFFEDNGSNIIPLSYGQNGATIYNLCHAEHNALLKLKNRDTKKIIGIIMLGASVGLLVYIYKGYLKPRLEVDAEIKAGATSPKPKTTTK